MNRTRTFGIIVVAASFAVTGCQRDDDALVKELRQTTQKLEQLDAKIDAIGNVAAARPAAARPERKRPTPGTLYAVPVSDTDPYRGGKHAKVTIVEAFEFACPYCAIVASAMDEVMDSYDDDEVRLVAKHVVVHPRVATDAALGACAAHNQGKFEQYEQALWKAAWNQGDRPSWKDRKALEPERLIAMAKSLGMNVATFKSDMASPGCKDQLVRHRREMTALGVTGTPGIFINGKYYVGARTSDAIKAAVDKELAAADKAMAKGVKLPEYYSSLTRSGKTKL